MSPDQYISSGTLELFAAGVLPPEEMEATAAMVADHPRIQEELKTILEAYRQYARFHTDRILPESVLESILEKIKQSPPPPPPAQTKQKPEPKAPKPAPAPTVARPAVQNVERPVYTRKEEISSQPKRSGGLVLGLITCLLLLMASAGFIYYLANELQNTKNELASLQKQYQQVSQEYADMRKAPETAPATAAPADTASGDMAVLQDMNYRILRLKGQTPSPEAESVLFWNKTDGKLYIRVYNLPAPPAGKQYQLWAIQPNDKAVDAGIITQLGPDKALVPMKSISSAKAFAVTLEKEGGSTQPTSAVYLLANI